MSISDDRRAMAVLWIVTAVITLLFGGFLITAIFEEPVAALMGMAGFLVGGLLAVCVGLSRRTEGQKEVSRDRILEAMADRLESLEIERGRVMELEERLEFAERLLAEGPQASRLEPRS